MASKMNCSFSNPKIANPFRNSGETKEAKPRRIKTNPTPNNSALALLDINQSTTYLQIKQIKNLVKRICFKSLILGIIV